MRIVKALEILSAYCEKHKCCHCRFNIPDESYCLLQKFVPCDWYDEYEKFLKKIMKGESNELDA